MDVQRTGLQGTDFGEDDGQRLQRQLPLRRGENPLPGRDETVFLPPHLPPPAFAGSTLICSIIDSIISLTSSGSRSTTILSPSFS